MVQALHNSGGGNTTVPRGQSARAPASVRQAMGSARAGQNSDATSGATAASHSGQQEQRGESPAQAWLKWQCRMIAGVSLGAVFDVSAGKLRSVRAGWPDTIVARDSLAAISEQALKADSVQILAQQLAQQTGHADTELFDLIAVPVITQHSIYIVALKLASRSQTQQEAVVQLLQWGGLWLGTMGELGLGGGNKTEDATLLSKVLSQQTMHGASVELTNSLAAELNCQRVSLGFRNKLSVRLAAISQLSDFDSKRQLVRSIEAAMCEAIDQECAIRMPVDSPDRINVTAAHTELQHQNGKMASCTLLLRDGDDITGAVLLERDASQPFSAEIEIRCENLLADIATVLSLKSESERSFASGALRDIKARLPALLIGKSKKSKLTRLGCCLAAVLLSVIPVQHKVVATASVEGADKQVLVAPQAGYVQSAAARAGEMVSAGQVIATLDDSDLSIERNKWLGELAKIETAHAQALGTRNRSEVGLLQARKVQTQAEIDLIDQKLERSVLRAPFDGVLVSGDLNQSLGAPVIAGDVLFEIASMESYRLLLEIDEHDVAGIKVGQPGKLRISALPGRTYQTTIKSMMPVAVSRDKRSVFQLEAMLDETSRVLRPGMRGIAKIETGQRALLWVMTHGLLDRLRLWLWAAGV